MSSGANDKPFAIPAPNSSGLVVTHTNETSEIKCACVCINSLELAGLIQQARAMKINYILSIHKHTHRTKKSPETTGQRTNVHTAYKL